MSTLRTAFAYFSILPAGSSGVPRADALAGLPLVGVALGGIAGSVGWIASVLLPAPLPVALAFAASLALSGALHLDGFLDCCDALFAGVPPERRFRILKDPAHGTFALAGLAIVAPLWLAAIAALPPAAWPWTFAFCAGIARATAVSNAWRLPYRPGGTSARAFEERPPIVILFIGVLVAMACCWTHPSVILLVPPALAVALALGGWCASRLGGVLAGDCYGAIIVLMEVLLLGAVATLLADGL